QHPARRAPAVGRSAARLGLRLLRPRGRAVGRGVPGAALDRLRGPDLHRVGGRRDGPPARREGGARAAAQPGLPGLGAVLRRGLQQPGMSRVRGAGDRAGGGRECDEREALAASFAALGPEAPTILPGWDAEDLLEHLVLRESVPHLIVGPRLPGALGRRAREARESWRDRPWTERV